jgi:Sulfotransferase family
MFHLLDDPCVASWLDYGSYVDEQRRIFYVETPKAACSSIKHLLRSLVTKEDIKFNPTHSETSIIMHIHDRPQIPLPPLTAFSEDRFREIVTGVQWFRFCVIRHPYDRFFSAWRDKIFLCEPSYEAYAPADNERFVRFSDFAARVVAEEDPFTCDPHWRSQTALLLPDDIPYKRIYNLDDLDHLAADLQEHLQTVGVSDQVAPLSRINQGCSISAEGFLTREVLTSLRQFYRSDFERFGFDEREATVTDAQNEAAIVNAFSDGVFSRNRLIARHINHAQAMERNQYEQAQRIAALEATLQNRASEWDSHMRALETEVERLTAVALEKTKENELLRTSLEEFALNKRA